MVITYTYSSILYRDDCAINRSLPIHPLHATAAAAAVAVVAAVAVIAAAAIFSTGLGGGWPKSLAKSNVTFVAASPEGGAWFDHV